METIWESRLHGDLFFEDQIDFQGHFSWINNSILLKISKDGDTNVFEIIWGLFALKQCVKCKMHKFIFLVLVVFFFSQISWGNPCLLIILSLSWARGTPWYHTCCHGKIDKTYLDSLCLRCLSWKEDITQMFFPWITASTSAYLVVRGVVISSWNNRWLW